jgi:transposase-like protein
LTKKSNKCQLKTGLKMGEITYYSDEFKKSVIKEVQSGQISKEEARRRHGIKGKSAILYWIRKFDPLQAKKMKKRPRVPKRDTTELEAENKRLREELELERLRSLSLNVMIDIAEEQFNVPIRKKSGAKQLKK